MVFRKEAVEAEDQSPVVLEELGYATDDVGKVHSLQAHFLQELRKRVEALRVVLECRLHFFHVLQAGHLVILSCSSGGATGDDSRSALGKLQPGRSRVLPRLLSIS